jgi:hypothetical protein
MIRDPRPGDLVRLTDTEEFAIIVNIDGSDYYAFQGNGLRVILQRHEFGQVLLKNSDSPVSFSEIVTCP